MTFLEFLHLCQQQSIRFNIDSGQLKVQAPPNTLKPDLVTKIREFKPKILQMLEDELVSDESTSHLSIPIKTVSRDRNLVSSFMQEQLWLTQQLNDSSERYHFVRILDLNGRLNVDALNAAFSLIIQRHEPLRTVFYSEDGRVFQKVLPATEFDIPQADLSHLDNHAALEQATQLSQHLATKPFDLSCDVMLRLKLIRLSEQRYQLVVVLHHIASDGWSLGVLVNEFRQLYTRLNSEPINKQGAHVLGLASESLAPLPYQYVDYASWQREIVEEESFSVSMQYWHEYLYDAPAQHDVTLEFRRPKEQSFAGKVFTTELPLERLNALKALAQSHGCTLFMLLESVYAVLLTRYCSNSKDLLIATSVANRQQDELQGLIGCFVNLVVLRHQIDESQTFEHLLSENKKNILGAFSHQHVPFEKLVYAEVKTRDGNYNPLAQVAFILQNNVIPTLSLPSLECVVRTPESHSAVFDLQLEASETEEGLELSWEFTTELFSPKRIAQMAGHFNRLLDAVLASPGRAITQLNMLSAGDIRQLMRLGTNTCSHLVEDVCIQQLFEAQAERFPDATALVFGAEVISYSELNARANQLAHYLIEHYKVEPDSLLGLCLERSIDMMVAILGVLKSGSAYLPLDPDYPQARLAHMLEDAKLKTVITQRKLLTTTPITSSQGLLLGDEAVQGRLKQYPQNNIDRVSLGLKPNHLAYVIYTSGSTGKPKGVMVEHRNAVNFLQSMANKPGMEADDCLLAVTSTSFDIHVLELMLPLVLGAKVVIASKEDGTKPQALQNLMNANQVSIMQATPATWKLLIDAGWDRTGAGRLKILCGGEALGRQLMEQLLARENVELWNMYGPTETAVWSCVNHMLPNKIADEGYERHIGRAIGNTQTYVCTDTQTLAPLGVAGELLIGGEGVTRGYLNRSELSAEKFIKNPFLQTTQSIDNINTSDGSDSKVLGRDRLYRTGDLVRMLPCADGGMADLEFLGRIDHQVKIRGFRIELGEIENTLVAHENVADAVVVAKTSNNDDKYLVAYAVLVNAQDKSSESDSADGDLTEVSLHDSTECLRQYLSQSLPDYMVPSAFMLLESFPLTPNGKVDRKALLEMDVRSQQKTYKAPINNRERQLCALYERILGVENVGTNDSFFTLGGNSLLVLQLVSEARKQSMFFSPKQLFSSPEISALVDHVKDDHEGQEQAPVSGKVFTSPSQDWFFYTEGAINDNEAWASAFDLEVDSRIGRAETEAICSHIVSHHDGLRTRFYPNDDGHSWHGLISEREASVPIYEFAVEGIVELQDYKNEVAKIVQELKLLIDVKHGKLFNFGIVKFGSNKTVVIFVLHHLLFDPYSALILQDDFTTACRQVLTGEKIQLQNKTASIIDVLDWVKNSEDVDRLGQELDTYLKKQSIGDFTLPAKDIETADELQVDRCVSVTFDVGFTRDLQRLENNIPGLNLQNILLFCLTKVYTDWSGSAKLQVQAVDAGRNIHRDHSNMDVSRTIGWLNLSRFLPLQIVSADSIKEQFCEFARALDELPAEGVVFGNPMDLVDSGGHKIFSPHITLNNIGVDFSRDEFDSKGIVDNGEIQYEYDKKINLDIGRSHPFALNVITNRKKLTMEWEYSGSAYNSETMQAVMHAFVAEIQTFLKTSW